MRQNQIVCFCYTALKYNRKFTKKTKNKARLAGKNPIGPFTRYNLLSNRLSNPFDNRFDNWLYRVNGVYDSRAPEANQR